MCAPHREKSNFRFNRQFSFHRYIYIYIYIYIYTYRRYSPRKEARKFLFMITERESCDYDIVMGKSLSEDEALNTFYFENMERAASKIQTSVCGS